MALPNLGDRGLKDLAGAARDRPSHRASVELFLEQMFLIIFAELQTR
jgi:hypothetical protein